LALALGIVATSADTASAACVRYYWVNQVPAPVRENPSSHSVVRKYKQVFDTVTGPCSASVRDPHSSRLYIPVYTRAATDGIGWMASQTIQRY
jgi:hypothetical protein